jgi:hypothetical protein
MTKLGRTTMIFGAVLALIGPALEADAATARVRCRVREARTQISVDGNRLEAGTYTATVDSATDGAGAVTATAPVVVAGKVRKAEFDFDSNSKDIAGGATAVPGGFVTLPGSINWQLVKDGAVILAGTQACSDK